MPNSGAPMIVWIAVRVAELVRSESGYESESGWKEEVRAGVRVPIEVEVEG